MARKPAKEADEKLAAPEKKTRKQRAAPAQAAVEDKAKKIGKKPDETSKKPPGNKPKVEKNGKNFREKPAKKPEKRKPLTDAEWRKIRMEYVKGKTTFAKLAEKYHISAGYIRKKASLERWSEKKRKLETKVEQKTIERVAEARARELEKLAAISDRVDDILDAVVDAVGKLTVRKHDDMRGLESLTKAVQISLQTKRDLYSLPNETDRAKIESLREKAKLDRQRYEDEKAEKAKMAQVAANTMIRVVIEGEGGGALDE